MNDAEARLTELRRLTSAQREAEVAEQKAATLHREARARRREAEQAVARWLSADAEPCPLFDVAPDVTPALPSPGTPEGGQEWYDHVTEDGPVSFPSDLAGPVVEDPPVDQFDPLANFPAREGRRKLAELTARGQRCDLYLWPDGRHHVVFDSDRFGNWDRDNLKGEEYWPTTDEVSAAATAAAGYPLESLDWGPLPGSLWQIELRCDLKDHPEPWRTTKLEWMPARWLKPLQTGGIATFGDLAARLEFWHRWEPDGVSGGLARIKGAPRKPLPPFASPAEELVALVRSEWATGVEAGRRGEFPEWLPGPAIAETPAPATPTPAPWDGMASSPDAWRHAGVGMALPHLEAEAVQRLAAAGYPTVGSLMDAFADGTFSRLRGARAAEALAMKDPLEAWVVKRKGGEE